MKGLHSRDDRAESFEMNQLSAVNDCGSCCEAPSPESRKNFTPEDECGERRTHALGQFPFLQQASRKGAF